jgi:hypothetical protein
MTDQASKPPSETPEKADLLIELDPVTASIAVGIRTQYGIAPTWCKIPQEKFWGSIGQLMITQAELAGQMRAAAVKEAGKRGLKLS